MIWQCAVNAVGQRVVDIIGGFPRKSPRDPLRTGHYGSPCPIPSILHACRQSRQLALKRWKLSFAIEGQPARIFFDFSDDILYFGECIYSMIHFETHVTTADREALRIIALDTQYYVDGEGITERVHQGMPTLSNVIFVGKVDEDFECPEKSVITLREHQAACDDWEVATFRHLYTQRQWLCPELKIMELHRSSHLPYGAA